MLPTRRPWWDRVAFALVMIFGGQGTYIYPDLLSPLQLHEIAVRMAANNILLTERAVFSSDIDLINDECSIVAHRPPEIRFSEENADHVVGKMLEHYCGPMLPMARANNKFSNNCEPDAIALS
jgi:hypothetical protein